jgi:hypothetical protein
MVLCCGSIGSSYTSLVDGRRLIIRDIHALFRHPPVLSWPVQQRFSLKVLGAWQPARRRMHGGPSDTTGASTCLQSKGLGFGVITSSTAGSKDSYLEPDRARPWARWWRWVVWCARARLVRIRPALALVRGQG